MLGFKVIADRQISRIILTLPESKIVTFIAASTVGTATANSTTTTTTTTAAATAATTTTTTTTTDTIDTTATATATAITGKQKIPKNFGL